MKKELQKHQWFMKSPMYLDKKDNRYKKYKNQLKKYSFCDSETWNLDTTIVEFILPRLKRFRKICPCYPGCFSTIKEWHTILDKIILAFEWYLKEGDLTDITETERKNNWKNYEEGMKLFLNHFSGLWW
jgi:hypothetical protein